MTRLASPPGAGNAEARRKALEEHVGELRARAEVRIDEGALSRLALEAAPRPGLQGHAVAAQPAAAASR